MEEAAEVRRAASAAVDDVGPARLRENLARVVEDGWMVPGVLTLLSARAADAAGAEDLVDRAAGVQLVYEGLALTRRLTREEPWTDAAAGDDRGDGAGGSDGAAGGRPGAGDSGGTDAVDGPGDADGASGPGGAAGPGTPAGADRAANLAVLAADVLVARGVSLLARTDAVRTAVGVIRRFGRNRVGREAGPVPDRSLEADVFELAVVAGATVVHPEPPRRLVEWAADLAATLSGRSLPDPAGLVGRVEVPAGTGPTPAPAGEGGTTSTDP